MEKIKILSIISNDMSSGGVEAYLYNVYSYIDMSDLQIDIFVPGRIMSDIYRTALENKGCKFFQGNINSGGRVRYFEIYKAINCHLRKNKYDVIHVNTGAITTEAICLLTAKKKHIRSKIAHSHGTVIPGGAIQELSRKIMRLIICHCSDYKLGCSTSAIRSLFGDKGAKNAIVAKNGIEVQKYKYTVEARNAIRREYRWDNKYVIGSVGRLSEEKNPIFLLELFRYIHTKNSDAILVYFGEGGLHSVIADRIKEYKLEEFVFLHGVKNNINEIMQGLDVLVLPSIREALGIVNIEAQTTGLSCVVSDAVPREVDITGLVSFLSLSDSISKWADVVMDVGMKKERKDRSKEVINAGYSIKDTARIIDKIYHVK